MSDKGAAWSFDSQINLMETLSAHYLMETIALIVDEGRFAAKVDMSIVLGKLSFDVRYSGQPSEAINARLQDVAKRYNVALNAAQRGFFSLS